MMKAEIYIKINKNYFVDGYIQYTNVPLDKQWVLYNRGYTLYFIDKKITDYEVAYKGLCVNKTKVNHYGSFSLKFQGYIDVPVMSSFVKKDDYLEVSGNCGFIPLTNDFSRCNFTVDAYIPQDYSLAGFKKIDECHYTINILQNYHVVFVMYKKTKVQICQNQNMTIYAGIYHDYEKLHKMTEICQGIWDSYKQWFSENEFYDLFIILNPRFENGAYAVNNIICLIDRIEGLNLETYMHLAHEISHLWWKNSDLTIHNNWVNETFAQYSALLLIRENYGKQKYDDIINQFQIETKDLPSLSSVLEDTPKDIWFPLFYKKGPYLFARLEKELGYDKMMNILFKCYQKRIKTSEQFLKICPDFEKYYYQY